MTTAQDKPDDTTPPVEGYAEFSDVFASLVENGEPAAPADEKSTTPVDTAAAAAKAATPPEGTPPADKPAAAATTPEGEAAEGDAAAATPEASATPETPATLPADDWKAKYDALVAAQAAAPKPDAEDTAAPVAPAKPAEAPPVYSVEETEFLKEYAKEWPDVIKGEALRRRDEYRQLTAHIFSEVERVFGPIAQRAAETAESFENDSTLRAITQAHPDYDDAMYDAVVAWAGGLNGYERTLAQGIIKEGSPRDVVDLVTRYKDVKGIKTAASATPAPAAPVKASVTELPAAAKKAAKALGVVDSKRGATTPTSVDPNDFDQAWDEAVGAK